MPIAATDMSRRPSWRSSASSPRSARGRPRDYPDLLQRVPAIVYIGRARRAWPLALRQPPDRGDSGLHARGMVCGPGAVGCAGCIPTTASGCWPARRATAAGRPPDGATEYRMLHRDGHTVWIRDDALLLTGPDGARRWHGVHVRHHRAEAGRGRTRAPRRPAGRRGQLGEHALEGASTSDLMQEAVAAAAALGVEIAAVAELLSDGDSFVLRAGCGFPDGSVGSALCPAGTRFTGRVTRPDRHARRRRATGASEQPLSVAPRLQTPACAAG